MPVYRLGWEGELEGLAVDDEDISCACSRNRTTSSGKVRQETIAADPALATAMR
jgi:hypothetical protein